jgi:elongation factor 1-alpha
MFTGASQADAAVLVASAKEGIQDQTKQHTFLIKMLGIQKLIVAVNKMDEANFEEAKFKEICMKLQPILDSLNYKNSPIVPISALKGENVLKKSERMGWYKGQSLIETLDDNVSSSIHPVDKPLRASVQDVYDPEGRRIIVCKILTGVMEKNKMISFDPSGVTDTIQKIDMLGKEVERAEAGDSVGIVVGNLAPVERGEVISYPQKRAKVPKSFVAEIILFSDVKVKNNEVLTIRCGTAQRKCKVEKILDRIDPVNLVVDAELPETLGNGDVGRIVLSPIEPLCVETYSDFPELGRFVVEGGKGTEAAGIIIETHSAAS